MSDCSTSTDSDVSYSDVTDHEISIPQSAAEMLVEEVEALLEDAEFDNSEAVEEVEWACDIARERINESGYTLAGEIHTLHDLHQYERQCRHQSSLVADQLHPQQPPLQQELIQLESHMLQLRADHIVDIISALGREY